jgi:hypothetical protein
MRERHLYRVGTAAAAVLSTAIASGPAAAQIPDLGDKLKDIGGQALKGVAVGYAVKQTAGPLNQFINAVTLRNGLADKQMTRVVPILSAGDKTYIGGAQVSGPAAYVSKTQAVWQLEGSKLIGDGFYRVKALVPSKSLNPLQLSRVPKVGVTAIIDVATGGPLRVEGPYSKPVRGGDLIKTGAVVVAVNAAAKPLNDFVNTLTFNKSNATSTKVVPMATFGEKAFVGAGQLSGSTTTLPAARALWQYEDLFDRGRFRVKILVPTNSDPMKLRRIQGVGMTALIDTSIQRQAQSLDPKPAARPVAIVPPLHRNAPRPPAPPVVVAPPHRHHDDDDDQGENDDRGGRYVDLSRLPPGQLKKLGLGKHDNGKHKGWYKGRGNPHGEHDD